MKKSSGSAAVETFRRPETRLIVFSCVMKTSNQHEVFQEPYEQREKKKRDEKKKTQTIFPEILNSRASH